MKNKYFFIGIAGSGMSAIAQFLRGKGREVSGSDRIFASPEGQDTKHKLEAEGIKCYNQGETVPDLDTDCVVVSTAIEETVPEYAFAMKNNLRILHRSKLLADIALKSKTIAVSGTSGKSTTTAMIYCILEKCGFSPSLISGAGLVELQNQGKIGNAAVGNSDYLVIESDESDGTIKNYRPSIGVILNIDRDHKEIPELMELFTAFARNTRNNLIVNQDNERSASLSIDIVNDFSCRGFAGNNAEDFVQNPDSIEFTCDDTRFKINVIGRHNMENAMAAISVARVLGISDKDSAAALAQYQGIYRRNRVIGNKNGIVIMDDFAHNPAKISASISACQAISKRVIAWFQPHGFAPSRMMKDELIERLAALLRPDDRIIFSKIYYAGGTADQSFSASTFADSLAALGKNALYIADRQDIIPELRSTAQPGDIILLMGARDPSLADFAETVKDAL
ncbi:MAG: UDP-N-acetylmuramate--alanine ligase [Bacteroidales bacterium]|nr:UDP-N-acetylmuramate--alanine ligase [Bacteroidales bacterium]